MLIPAPWHWHKLTFAEFVPSMQRYPDDVASTCNSAQSPPPQDVHLLYNCTRGSPIKVSVVHCTTVFILRYMCVLYVTKCGHTRTYTNTHTHTHTHTWSIGTLDEAAVKVSEIVNDVSQGCTVYMEMSYSQYFKMFIP